jgi:hypothetical protein
MALRWIALAGAATFATGAAGDVYFRDASIEISGSGTRSNCKVVLLPAQTLGEAQAPRLTLLTVGLSRLSFDVDTPAQYGSVTLVQHNLRMPLGGRPNAAPQEFLSSETGKALRSQRVFFVTGQRNDTGKLVSSRYERLDFDAILRRIEMHCPFDAEALMSDIFDRERAERALMISPADLKRIRWALNKRMTGSSSEPEARPALSPAERSYLKRYAVENSLPVSQYLTADVSRKLTLEGTQLERVALQTVGRRPESGDTPATVRYGAVSQKSTNFYYVWNAADLEDAKRTVQSACTDCRVVTTLTSNQCFALFRTKGGGWGWGRADTIETATELARSECVKHNPKHACIKSSSFCADGSHVFNAK